MDLKPMSRFKVVYEEVYNPSTLMGWIFMHMRCALDTLASFFTSLHCWHSTKDRTIPCSQVQHKKITTWNYDVILVYVNVPDTWMQNMGKTKNKFLGTTVIAIYNTNPELCYANNHQHTQSCESYESQLFHFMKLFCLRKSMNVPSLSIHRKSHHMNFTKSTCHVCKSERNGKKILFGKSSCSFWDK
jgi:hypothetical protein